MANCDMCGTERESGTADYDPFTMLAGNVPGWYSGDDGEICGPCMVKIYVRANGL